jgi:hypothetical protein
MWKRGKENLVWQAGRLETYQNTILGLFSVIIKKNRKSFGRLEASASVDSLLQPGMCDFHSFYFGSHLVATSLFPT